MVEVRNLFLMIHGMVTNPLPEEPYGEYITFWKALVAAQPRLTGLFSGQPIQVEWGHQLLLAVQPNVISRSWHQKKVIDETAELTLKWALNPVPDEVLA
jgi:hypothetical protein